MLSINIFNGLVYGAFLGIMCSGLALIYGLRRIINFAHGAFYMVGAYFAYSVAAYGGFWTALIVVPCVMAGLGFVLDRYAFRLLQDRDPLSIVLVTFGLAMVLEDLVRTVWGTDSLSIAAPELLKSSVELRGMQLPAYRLAVGAAGLGVALGLSLWLRFGRAGLFVRAASTDPTTTAMQGVNIDVLSAGIVGLGVALAGLAGVVAAPFLSLSPSMSNDILIDSFVVVVIGGLGSLTGAFVAAIVLGLVQSLGAVYLPSLSAILPFALMIGVLLWRPAGLAGSRT
jgi:branched-chain amino acid transport system permease protein